MGIDKIYRKEKPYVFIWSVTLAGVSNFYFFYMIGIFMVLYAAFEYFHMFEKCSLKDIGRWLAVFAVYSLIAVMMAAVVLLPVLIPLFGTQRFQAENYVPLLYDRVYYEKYLGCLIGENMIQWGVAGILCRCYGRRVCSVCQKEKVYKPESRIPSSEYFPADPFCRPCPERFFPMYPTAGYGPME